MFEVWLSEDGGVGTVHRLLVQSTLSGWSAVNTYHVIVTVSLKCVVNLWFLLTLVSQQQKSLNVIGTVQRRELPGGHGQQSWRDVWIWRRPVDSDRRRRIPVKVRAQICSLFCSFFVTHKKTQDQSVCGPAVILPPVLTSSVYHLTGSGSLKACPSRRLRSGWTDAVCPSDPGPRS